jgi:hypothetical protein
MHIISCVDQHMYLIGGVFWLLATDRILVVRCADWQHRQQEGTCFGQHLYMCPGAGMVELLALKGGPDGRRG